MAFIIIAFILLMIAGVAVFFGVQIGEWILNFFSTASPMALGIALLPIAIIFIFAIISAIKRLKAMLDR